MKRHKTKVVNVLPRSGVYCILIIHILHHTPRNIWFYRQRCSYDCDSIGLTVKLPRRRKQTNVSWIFIAAEDGIQLQARQRRSNIDCTICSSHNTHLVHDGLLADVQALISNSLYDGPPPPEKHVRL